MLSSDKNVETIAQLIEMLKQYLGHQTEYVKLEVIEKVIKLVVAIVIGIVLLLVFVGVMLFLALALASWLSQYMGYTGALLTVAGCHALLLALCYIFRKSWIERPLVRYLANILMNE